MKTDGSVGKRHKYSMCQKHLVRQCQSERIYKYYYDYDYYDYKIFYTFIEIDSLARKLMLKFIPIKRLKLNIRTYLLYGHYHNYITKYYQTNKQI